MSSDSIRASVEQFPLLQAQAWLKHGFVGRVEAIDVREVRELVMPRLYPVWREVLLRPEGERNVWAEQVHGGEVAIVDARRDADAVLPGVDALVTAENGVVLNIVVADCCAVYLVDTKTRAVGLCHSGKKGTEKNIVGKAIEVMVSAFGTSRGDIVAQLSPCIRPPRYEVDIAGEIVRQLRDAGVKEVEDCGICTGENVDRYYSYRMEKGLTGRMLAFLGVSG